MLDAEDVSALLPDTECSLFVFAHGFETRCTHLIPLASVSRYACALPFLSHQNPQFVANGKIFDDFHVERLSLISETNFEGAFAVLVSNAIARGPTDATIGIDISSFTRARLASIVAVLQDASQFYGRRLCARFYYTPAAFDPPLTTPPSVLAAEPVSSRFRGQLRRSSVPVGAVIGLGYEPQRAMGVYELLEPTQAWAFSPIGADDRYLATLETANGDLVNSLGQQHVFDYPVLRPADAYASLESFLFSISAQYRLVLVPMGPKTFALVCLLLGAAPSQNAPAVWRVGEKLYTDPRDVRPGGRAVFLDVDFEGGAVVVVPPKDVDESRPEP